MEKRVKGKDSNFNSMPSYNIKNFQLRYCRYRYETYNLTRTYIKPKPGLITGTRLNLMFYMTDIRIFEYKRKR